MSVWLLYKGITTAGAQMCQCLEVLDVLSDSRHGHFAKQTRYYHVLHPYGKHCAAWEEKTVFWQKRNTTLYIAVNKHASQSQVEDILRLTATSKAANTRVFNCVTVFSYNIAVDVRL